MDRLAGIAPDGSFQYLGEDDFTLAGGKERGAPGLGYILLHSALVSFSSYVAVAVL